MVKLRRKTKSRRRGAARSHSFIEGVILNLAGDKSKVRRCKLEGKMHVVVPCVMITEGVHEGNNGPGLYREKDTADTAVAWNHRPVVVYHPKKNGKGISAADPDVLNSSKVGIVLNTRWDAKKKKLRCDVWLNEARCNEVDDRILTAINNGEQVEVSTGLLLNRRKEKGEWNGEAYEWIATHQTPDHLAILPDEIGACSIKDGAGLLQLNSSNKKLIGLLRKAGLVVKSKSRTTNRKGKKMLSTKRKRRMVTRLIQNSTIWDEKDKKTLMDMPDMAFKKVYRAAEEADEEPEPTTNRKAKKKVVEKVSNSTKKKRLKIADAKTWLKKTGAPKEIVAIFNRNEKAEERRKKKFIEIIDNSETNPFSVKWLEQQDVELLEGMAQLASGVASEEDEDGNGMFNQNFQGADFSGAAGSNLIQQNSRKKRKKDEDEDDEDDEDDGLPLPSLYEPVENEGGKKHKKGAA